MPHLTETAYLEFMVSWILGPDISISMFIICKTDYVQCWFLYNSELRISATGKRIRFIIKITSDKVFKGIAVNRALPPFHGGSLEITCTVPLILEYTVRNMGGGD